MNRIVRIPSRLYRNLFEKGGDRLVSVFCTIKDAKNQQPRFYSFKSKNQKTVSGYALLRNQTNISLVTLQKHVAVLKELGLLCFEPNGDVTVIGNESSKTLYSCNKLVPITIGKNIIETAYNSMMVRVHSNSRQQQIQIDKKQQRSDLLKQIHDPASNEIFKRAKRVQKKYGDEIELTSAVVLSNVGFAKLKVHDAKPITKSKGIYWKRKLQKQKLISCKREFKLIAEMPYSEYQKEKKNYCFGKDHIYCNGFFYRELISSLLITV